MIRVGRCSLTSGNSKPRASGDDPQEITNMIKEEAVNPARAGMIRTWWMRVPRRAGKPRASGDDPATLTPTPTSAA